MFYENLINNMKGGLSRNEAAKEADRILAQVGLDEAGIGKIRNGSTPGTDTVINIASYIGVGAACLDPKVEVTAKAYLAGPITGHPDFMETFRKYENLLVSAGIDVMNPAKITSVMPHYNMTRNNFMDLGIVCLGMCDIIIMLPDWNTASGCRMEKAWARAHQMPVLNVRNLENKKPSEIHGIVMGRIRENKEKYGG